MSSKNLSSSNEDITNFDTNSNEEINVEIENIDQISDFEFQTLENSEQDLENDIEFKGNPDESLGTIEFVEQDSFSEDKLIVSKIENFDENLNINDDIKENNDNNYENKEVIPSYRKYENQDVTSEDWKRHYKHIFIMSKAGKPIFTRYGSETDLNTLMGVFSIFIDVINQDESDEIQYFEYNNFRLIFKLKNEIVLLAMVNMTLEPKNKDEDLTLITESVKSMETNKELEIQLDSIYNQIEFFVTSLLQSKLKQQQNFDVRKVLGGTDAILHNLISTMSRSLNFSWQSYRTLRLNKTVRSYVSDLMIKNRPEDLCYSILLSNGQAIQIQRKKNWVLYASDLLLLINFVKSNSSLKSADAWIPLCLPKVKNNAFLFAYISYLDVESDLCLMYICSKGDKFEQCAESKEKLLSSLKKDKKLFDHLIFTCKTKRFSTLDLKLFPHVRHFVYFNPSNNQIVDTRYILPYNRKEQQKRLIREYKSIREKIISESSTTHPVYFQISDYESILAYHGPQYELYASFSLLVSKQQAIIYCESIKKYIKKFEDSFFLTVHTF